MVSDLPTAAFLVFVLVLLGYELVLGLTVPQNNTDALAYHLAKAAAWAQHGGVYWIPDPPTVRMNAFQPFAEQQLLFLLVAVHGGRLIALPQFLAELAIIVAVYGSARRLGFAVRPAACAAFLLATFSLFALEATTAQNDIVAASFPAVAVCLLLGPGRIEPLLAGMAAGIGLGVKLTTALVLPVLIWLAVRQGRRPLAAAVVGGRDRVRLARDVGLRPEPRRDGPCARRRDRSAGGQGIAVVSGKRQERPLPAVRADGPLRALEQPDRMARRRRARSPRSGSPPGRFARRRRRTRFTTALGVALPFVAPVLVLVGAALIADATGWLGFPLRGPNGALAPLNESLAHTYTRISSSDYSALGPLAIVALIAASLIAVIAYVRHRADARHLALACALPCFLVLISATTSWTPFLIRFFTVPAVLAAPLLAWLFRGRATIAAYAAVGALTVSLTVIHDPAKPLSSPYGFGRPWNLSQRSRSRPTRATTTPRQSPGSTAPCLPAASGAIVGESDPTYLLYGSHFQRHVVYLPQGNPVTPADRERADGRRREASPPRQRQPARAGRLEGPADRRNMATRHEEGVTRQRVQTVKAGTFRPSGATVDWQRWIATRYGVESDTTRSS